MTPEEIGSQVALEYGQAMTVRVCKADGESMRERSGAGDGAGSCRAAGAERVCPCSCGGGAERDGARSKEGAAAARAAPASAAWRRAASQLVSGSARHGSAAPALHSPAPTAVFPQEVHLEDVPPDLQRGEAGG